jgi:hypothetical protein
MGPEVKMTKQGVRDLNHLGQKKKPTTTDEQKAAVTDADKILVPTAAPGPVSVPPIEG